MESGENEETPFASKMDSQPNDNVASIFKLIREEEQRRNLVTRRIATVSMAFSVLLFITLTCVCIARPWRLDAVSVVMGYWLGLFIFCCGYVTSKTVEGQKLPRIKFDYETIGRFKKFKIRLQTENEIFRAISGRWLFFLGLSAILFGCTFYAGLLLQVYLAYTRFDWIKGLKLFYGCLIAMDGIVVAASTKWCKKRKMIFLWIVFNAALAGVTILMTAIYEDVKLLRPILRKEFSSSWYYNEYIGSDLNDIEMHWPRSNTTDLLYPNWQLIGSFTL